MIRIAGKEVTALYYVDPESKAWPIQERWWVDENRVPHLVWQAVRSCYGAGYWINEKPWIDNEAWKD